MIYIPNVCHDAALNLAKEEYILSSGAFRDEVLFFYINAPSVIIGRHQNTVDEINSEFVREHDIQVVRRCSGGGAVYHDLGNLNYSLITPGLPKAADFSALLKPILAALHEIGLPAELNGRNDLTLNGAKFSGNAYYRTNRGSVIHGTLLFDSDLDMLTKVLKPHPEKLSSKGVQSVRSRVCLIKNELPDVKNTEELESAIVRHFNTAAPLEVKELTDPDMQAVKALAEKRYYDPQWNYGESPAFTLRRTFRYPGGWIDFRADVREGIVHSIRFFGDFFCSYEICELENSLSGTAWERNSTYTQLAAAGWDRYFPGFPLSTFIESVFGSSEGNS